MSTIENLIAGFGTALQPSVLFYCLIGCLVGTVVGMLPGLGPLAAISLLLPATFGLNPTVSLIMLAGIYYGAMYGGSTTSVLMRIPGETASVVTCIDGYAMAQRGRAGAALCIAAVGSFVAGTLAVVALMLVAPPLASFALRFGPPEMTALLVLSLLALSAMGQGSTLATLATACFGLLIGSIGIDPMSGYSRFSFGITEFGDGLGLIPVAVGLFGISEILLTAAGAEKRQGAEPEAARARAVARGAAPLDRSDRPRQRAGLPDRAPAGRGARHLVVHVVCDRAQAVEASGAVRTRRGRRRGRAGVGQQRGLVRRLRADAVARHPVRYRSPP